MLRRRRHVLIARRGRFEMSKTKKRLAASAVGLLITTVAAIGAISLSGAAAPAQGASGPYAVAVSPFTANTPYASGQMINVVVPANSLFLPTSGVNILECSAPDGVLPPQPQDCDGNTIQTSKILPASDGSINLQTQGDGLYEVFALPDSISLGEGPSNEVTCGDTAATECVLYIGNNQGDFSHPHIFSQPFSVSANATDSGTPAGDGSAPATTTPASTTLATSLSGGGQSGSSVSVPTATAVTDTAT